MIMRRTSTPPVSLQEDVYATGSWQAGRRYWPGVATGSPAADFANTVVALDYSGVKQYSSDRVGSCTIPSATAENLAITVGPRIEANDFVIINSNDEVAVFSSNFIINHYTGANGGADAGNS